jgi:sulfatase modifying factor 1
MLTSWLLVLACSPPEGGKIRHAGTDTSPVDTSDTSDTSTELEEGPCPREMALAGAACVDRWEAGLEGWSPYEVPEAGVAVSSGGAVPQGYISGDVAAEACEAAGKRLCSVGEWMRACGGPEATTYPYGDSYDAVACNDTYEGGHPVVDYFGTSSGVWDTAHMNDAGINQQPGTVAAAGANTGCVTPEGIFDLHGNLHEWVDDPDGTFKGGFYADAVINGAGCGYTTSAHTTDYHDYSTGFRCCKAPSPAE